MKIDKQSLATSRQSLLIVGQPHCLPGLFMKTYDRYPANVLAFMAYNSSLNPEPEGVLLGAFESLDAHEYWIPEFVQDRLVQQ